MVYIQVKCIYCSSENVIKGGKDENGKQRYLCKNPECSRKTFKLDYTYNACIPEVKSKILDMTLNASGIRDTARVLKISPNTVISELKKTRCTGKC